MRLGHEHTLGTQAKSNESRIFYSTLEDSDELNISTHSLAGQGIFVWHHLCTEYKRREVLI